MTTIDELSPVSGRESVFFTLVMPATVVVVAAAATVVVVVAAGATGVPAAAIDAMESPIPFTALMLTEYVVPLVRPLMVNGLAVVAGFSTT